MFDNVREKLQAALDAVDAARNAPTTVSGDITVTEAWKIVGAKVSGTYSVGCDLWGGDSPRAVFSVYWASMPGVKREPHFSGKTMAEALERFLAAWNEQNITSVTPEDPVAEVEKAMVGIAAPTF